MSRVTWHMSYVMCHMSRVICHFFFNYFFLSFFWQNGGASQCRVCYQRCLTRLVLIAFRTSKEGFQPDISKQAISHDRTKPQNVGTCYKMKYMNINVPPSQDFIEAKELKSWGKCLTSASSTFTRHPAILSLDLRCNSANHISLPGIMT
jgi:hypothetical protein